MRNCLRNSSCSHHMSYLPVKDANHIVIAERISHFFVCLFVLDHTTCSTSGNALHEMS